MNLRLTLPALVLAALVGCGSPATAERQATPAKAEAKVPPTLAGFAPLLGVSVEQATKWLAEHPTPCPGNERVVLKPDPNVKVTVVRVVFLDGQGLAVLADLRANRINVSVEKGVIVELIDVG
jgi:hypothetical protein